MRFPIVSPTKSSTNGSHQFTNFHVAITTATNACSHSCGILLCISLFCLSNGRWCLVLMLGFYVLASGTTYRLISYLNDQQYYMYLFLMIFCFSDAMILLFWTWILVSCEREARAISLILQGDEQKKVFSQHRKMLSFFPYWFECSYI